MKRNKILTVICAALLCCVFLSGCVINVGQVFFSLDGSGTCTIYTGYPEETYLQLLESMGEPTEGAEYETYTYGGKTYVGDIINFAFGSIEELNETFAAREDDSCGIVNFEQNDKGQIRFTVEVVANEEYQNLSEEDKQSYEEMYEGVTVGYDIVFPANVTQIAGTSEGVTVDGNRVEIDMFKVQEVLCGKADTLVFESAKISGFFKHTETLSFGDVPKNAWFYEPVMSMAEQKLVEGKGGNMFYPDDTMTKAEFITVISRAVYGKGKTNLLVGDKNIWWDKYYKACTETGLFYEEELPYESMTQGMQRQEMALVVQRAVEYALSMAEDVEKTAVIPDFDAVGELYADAVSYCYEYGILSGVDEAGTFNPTGTLTRAEASTVIMRMLSHIESQQALWSEE